MVKGVRNFMNFYRSKTYIKDVKSAITTVVDINRLKNSSILITGATGLIGSFIVDMLLIYNEMEDSNITIYALGRSKERLSKRFDYVKTNNLKYIEHDVVHKPNFGFSVDYIIHAASNAYPAAFNNDPVGTIMSNIQGTKNLLDYGRKHYTKRMLFISSGEVYGNGDSSIESFDESYSGYVDPTLPRSSYPNSKRAGETLCTSYTKQYGLDTVIARPCHTYGPNATSSDNRASVQFLNNALKGEDIALKSPGNELRSYCYIADCASGIISVLLNGKSCEAYNIANPMSTITIAGFASIVAQLTGKKIIYLEQDEIAIEEKTPIKKQVLCSNKIEKLGWKAKYGIEEGIAHTLAILKEINYQK